VTEQLAMPHETGSSGMFDLHADVVHELRT